MTRAHPTLEVTPANVELVALKRSEEGRELVVRLMEHAGRRTTCELAFHRPEGRTRLSIGPYQLKTLLVRRTRAGLAFRETNLVEE